MCFDLLLRRLCCIPVNWNPVHLNLHRPYTYTIKSEVTGKSQLFPLQTESVLYCLGEIVQKLQNGCHIGALKYA
jgi:hypothetical protein